MKAELYKLRRDRSFLTLTFILIGIAVLYPLLIVFDEGANLVKVSDLYLHDILGGNNYIIRLVPCILAGFFISSEYSIGTMKSIGASGNSRLKIYFAKLVAFSIGAVIISLIFPIVFTGAGAVYFGFNGMPDLGYFVRTICLVILYAAAFASIMAVFSIIFTDSGKTIGFLILFFLIIDSLLYVLSSKIASFKPILNYSVFKLAADISKMDVGNGELLKLILVPILTIVAFGLLGSLVFQRKEIR